MDFALLAAVFTGGMLLDHFVLNKLAGMVTGEVAKLQADLAHITGKLAGAPVITSPPPAAPVSPPPPPAAP